MAFTATGRRTSRPISEQFLDLSGDPAEPPSHTYNYRVCERVAGAWKIVLHAVFETFAAGARTPLIEVDTDGRVLWANRAAEHGLRDHPGLTISAGILRA